MTAPTRERFGWFVRLRIGFQVLLGVLLALAAAALVTWLASRPGLRWRHDVTVESRNTLPDELSQIVGRLPIPVEFEVFFQRPSGPLAQIQSQAQERMRELLFLARTQYPEQIHVVDHDLADRAGVSNRMRELALEEVDVVVAFTRGKEKSRSVLKLLRDIARVDPGNPAFQTPPSLEAFRGEVAMALALLKVAQDDAPKVYFATGHGERDPYDTDPRQLGRLETALVSEGFEVKLWNSKSEPAVPADCTVLALVAPTQLYDDKEINQIEAYLRRGGRALVAPSYAEQVFDGPGSLSILLRRFGVEPKAGLVAQYVRSTTGAMVDGMKECATLAIGPDGMDRRHPITESLWRARLVLPISGARAFERGKQNAQTVMSDILRSPSESWLDLAGDNGLHDWALDSQLEEQSGQFVLAFAVSFAVASDVQPGADAAPKQGRLLAFGAAESMTSAIFDYTRDFLLNAFNWLADREYRVSVRPRERNVRQIDLKNSFALSTVQRVAGIGLPLGLALIGMVLAWRRRR